ncbi:hypothetical protein D9M68_800990 [compost metagenome]
MSTAIRWAQLLMLTSFRPLFSIASNTAPLGFTAFAVEAAEGFFIGPLSSWAAAVAENQPGRTYIPLVVSYKCCM